MVRARTRSKVTQGGKSRINIRLPADLDTFVKGYATAHNTTVTQLIVDYFMDLRRKQQEQVEQI